jgi:hypothetical protein
MQCPGCVRSWAPGELSEDEQLDRAATHVLRFHRASLAPPGLDWDMVTARGVVARFNGVPA